MNVTRISSKKEGTEVEVKSFAMVEDVRDAILAASSALEPEAKSAFSVLEVSMRKYRFFKDTFGNEKKHLQELETGSALHQSMNLVLASLS